MLVVVQHDDQIAVQMTGGIQSFVGQAGAQAAVADHRDHLALRSVEILRFDHAKRRGDRGAGVARAENIVFAFLAAQKSAQAAELANRPSRSRRPQISLCA